MSGRKSKQAGSRFEGMVTRIFRDHGWVSNRLRSFRVEGEPDLYATKDGLLLDIQAKERQQLNVHKTLVDLIRAQPLCGGPQDGVWATPAVVYRHMEKRGSKRMQEGPITITLPLNEFLALVDLASRGRVVHTCEEQAER